MYAVNPHDKQRAFVDKEGDCTCLVHHPLDKTLREGLIEIVRSGRPELAVLAAEGLKPCPTREKKAKRSAQAKRARAAQTQKPKEA